MGEFRLDILFNAVPLLLEGLKATILVSLAAFCLAFLIGMQVGIAGAESARARRLLAPYVEIFRGTPLLKDSSLVSVLAITELTRVSQLIYTRTIRAFEVYLSVGALYCGMIYTVALLSRYLENQFQVVGRFGR